MSACAALGSCPRRLQRPRERGFTLMEVVITAAILAVLATAALPMSELAVRRTKEIQLYDALREMRAAIDAYKRAADEGRVARLANESGYPRSLQVLVEGVPDAKSPSKAKIYFLRRIPREPFAERGLAPADTWGKRSYSSPPEAPQEGEDVYDVYSLSTEAGLNGVDYRLW
jgi:general secretion pathway protein G